MRWYAKRDGQALKVVQRDVPCLPFDMRNEGSVQAALKRQSLLRPAFELAQP